MNLRGALQKFTDVPQMWRANQLDASIWLITMATSALVNTELGLLVGIFVSAFCVLGRTQQAKVSELGRASEREYYEDLSSYRGLRKHNHVPVFRYNAPIYYANQSLFKKSLYKSVGLDPVREKGKRMKRKKKQSVVVKGLKNDEKEVGTTLTLMLDKKSLHKLSCLVLDCSSVLFLDSAGVSALKEVRKDFAEIGVSVALAQCNTSVLDALERGGFFPENKENELVFFTIDDAVHFVQNLSVSNGDSENI